MRLFRLVATGPRMVERSRFQTFAARFLPRLPPGARALNAKPVVRRFFPPALEVERRERPFSPDLLESQLCDVGVLGEGRGSRTAEPRELRRGTSESPLLYTSNRSARGRPAGSVDGGPDGVRSR
jgi:hypothetical protein